MISNNYKAELKWMKLYIITVPFVIFFSYSIYLFCSDSTIEKMKDENQFFELGTAILFLTTSLICIISYRHYRNIFILLLSILLFFGAGEELSWGQNFIGFKTPDELKKINVQKEFNLHNIEIFNTNNFDHTQKKGWRRLFEINFLFRVFIILYGIILPLTVFHNKWIKKIVSKIKIPIPPISLGLFFLVSWLVFIIVLYFLPAGKNNNYYESAGEIFEFLTAYVFFLIGIYFFKMRKENIMGIDIKDYLIQSKKVSSALD